MSDIIFIILTFGFIYLIYRLRRSTPTSEIDYIKEYERPSTKYIVDIEDDDVILDENDNFVPNVYKISYGQFCIIK